MKNLELEGFGFVEMTNEEMIMLDGGSWVGDALRWIFNHKEEIVTVAICVYSFVTVVCSNL